MPRITWSVVLLAALIPAVTASQTAPPAGVSATLDLPLTQGL
jgi:hypothetical protein